MTTKQILAKLASGSTLCLGYDKHGEQSWWLEPSRLTVRNDLAEKLITLPDIEPGGDSLFSDFRSQTWKLNGGARHG